MKVGRAPLDEDAIRLIEEHNPDLEFDWTRILKGQGREAMPERRPPPPNVLPQQPSSIEIEEDEAPVITEAPREAHPVDEPLSAAGRKLGAEGLSRLRGRYAEMLARITDRVADRERQVELKTVAERLNPDAWVTDADVLAGLDGYEATFETLRGIVGHRRRRVRRQRTQP